MAPESEAAAPNLDNLPNGTILAEQFRLERRLGVGGLGPLYRAHDGEGNRPVALRILRPEITESDEVLLAIQNLVEATASLEQKNLVQTYGLAFEGDRLLLVHEFVDGQSLSALLEKKRKAGKPFTLKGSYNVVAHVCNALAFAHQMVFHGALHPGNILVNRAGRIKVADWGLAQVLAPLGNASSLLAKNAFFYLAPEVMVEPEAASISSDVYSIGVLLTELLTGVSPSETLDLPSKVRPDLPEELDMLVERCLSPAPADRFGRVEDLKQAMLNVIELVAQTRSSSPGMQAAAAQPAQPAPQAAKAPQPPAAPTPALEVEIDLGGPSEAPPGGPPPAPAGDGPLGGGDPILTSGDFDLANLVSDTHGEDEEKYLIQKNKLDYGPFSFNDVKVQIRVGDIAGNDFIVDTSTGERMKVKNHPVLGEYFAGVQRHKELQRRAETETATQSAERRKKHIFTLTAVGAAVVVGLVVAAIFIYKGATKKKKKPTRRTEKELSYEAGWEEEGGPGMSGRRRRRRRRGRGGSWSGGKWDDKQSIDFGSEGGGGTTLSRRQIASVMARYNQRIGRCLIKHGQTKVRIRLQIRPTGKLGAVRTGLPSAADRCIKSAIRSAKFPTFTASKTNGSYSLRVQ